MKQQRVYEQLRKAIYSNEIKPGKKLSERQIAEKFNTSRSAIRESLLRLAGEGLVTRSVGESCFVEDLTIADVRDIWLMRATIEPVAARLATERPERGVVERLLELADRMAEELRLEHDEESAALDLEFHREVVNASRSPRLIRAYDLSHVPMLMSRMEGSRGTVEGIRELHREYALVIGGGDAARAEQLAREHVIGVSQAISRGG